MGDLEKMPPQIRKAVEQARAIRGLGLIFGGLAFFGIGGAKMKEMSRQANDLAAQAEDLVSLPVEFNARFQSYGWLMSESASVEAAKEAIALYDQRKVDDANALLCTQFDGEKLDFLIMRMKAIPEFLPRYEIVRIASMLSQSGQFTAAIPLIFIAVDGIASDALGKSIFAEGVDVSEMKALAGSADGFPQLVANVSNVRRKTNTEEITFPYRNGIIHGKDLNYGNKFVAAKCWSLLSCLSDILRAKRAVDEVEDKRPLKEIFKEYQRTRESRQRIEEWTPRERIIISEDGTLAEQAFPEGTPEHTLCQFLDFWSQKNYGKMGELTVYYDKRPIGRRAGQIRDDLSDIHLESVQIIEMKDEAPAVTEIKCALTVAVNADETTGEFSFRLIYMDSDMNPILRGEPNGAWLIMPSYQGWALGKRFGR